VDISHQGDDSRQAAHRSSTFTGDVWGEPLLSEVPNTTVNKVRFAPGARTFWHRHEDGQLLYATDGKGKVRARDGQEATLLPGDAVWTRPGEEHYHGSDGEHFFSHVSISFGETDWLEPVSDEDYTPGPQGGENT
jgi:quercetin dioxygenase-like cupin family protein